MLKTFSIGSNRYQMECDDAPKLCFLALVHAQGRWCTRGSVDQGVLADPLSRMWAHPLLWGGSLVGVEWVCVDLFTMACQFDEVWDIQSM